MKPKGIVVRQPISKAMTLRTYSTFCKCFYIAFIFFFWGHRLHVSRGGFKSSSNFLICKTSHIFVLDPKLQNVGQLLILTSPTSSYVDIRTNFGMPKLWGKLNYHWSKQYVFIPIRCNVSCICLCCESPDGNTRCLFRMEEVMNRVSR